MGKISYTPPPTCGDFMLSDSFGRIIAGPVGSGKTTACLFELFRRSSEQSPAPDGYRYTRWAILRQTLKQLKDTVLKDIMSWFKGAAQYKVSENVIHIQIGDIRSEWLLLPLEDPEDQRRLLSMQLTGAWVSEAIEINVDLLDAIAGRCGRYPSGPTGTPTWFGIIADTNFPTEGGEWHKFMEDPPGDWQVFKQPSGLSNGAENLQWLTQTEYTLSLPENHPDRLAQGRSYYKRLAEGRNVDWIKRYVQAEYGNDPSGLAVFRESFLTSFHVVKRDKEGMGGLQPVRNAPLLCGLDFGRDPCMVICQLDALGRLLVLGESIVENMGLEFALTRHHRPLLMSARYIGHPIVVIGDPAGVAKDSLYDVTSFDVLKANNFTAFPAPTNDIDARIEAVEAFLLQQRQGAGAFLIDGDFCPTLTAALNGGYRFAKTKTGQTKPTPDKNKFSHVMDGLQYAALAAHGGMTGMIARRLSTPRRANSGPGFTAQAWT